MQTFRSNTEESIHAAERSAPLRYGNTSSRLGRSTSMYRFNDYPCIITKHGTMGFLCGYVGVPSDHPLHSQDYISGDLYEIEVHGGLSYSGENPTDGLESHLWWLGFDCAHAGDSYIGSIGGTYRTVEYVTEECKKLIDQLEALRDNANHLLDDSQKS